MRVQEIWRYPVKSIGGERLASVQVGRMGVTGDRAWAVRDDERAEITWGGDTPALMRVTATTGRGGDVRLGLPTGKEVALLDPDAPRLLSEVTGKQVSLVPSEPEYPEQALHVVTAATLRTLADALPHSVIDVTRFRPNLVLEVPGDGYPEHEWLGRRVRIGAVTIRFTIGCARCVMITLATTVAAKDRRVLQHVARDLGNILGVYAAVDTPGQITESAQVTWDY
jgi:uncharacterized protein YcbX